MQKQVKQAVLPKYGFNWNTASAVVYGDPDLAGIGLRTLSVEKGLAQLQALSRWSTTQASNDSNFMGATARWNKQIHL